MQERYILVFVLFVALLGGVAVQAQTDGPVLVLADGPGGFEKADGDTAAIDGTEWSESPIVENGLTITVLFKDAAGSGFRDTAQGVQRRARLYDALRYVAGTLNAPGELVVMIGASESDGTGALAKGGPLFTLANGLTNGSVFQRLSTGTVPFPGYAEMSLTFDWGYKWHAGSASPPSDALDLQSVAVHEITHCLGFISLISADGSSRFSGSGVTTYTVFDSLLARKSPLKRLVGGTSALPVFAGTTAELTGSAVVFDGATVLSVLGSRPDVYASSPFLQGTSLQHWLQNMEEGAAVMQPSYAYGVARREYSDADLAVLRDIGWTGVEAVESEPCPIQSVAFVAPSASTVEAGSSNKAVVALRAAVTLDTSDSLCSADDGTLRVEYFVEGTSRGVSGDAAGQFPLSVTLVPGTYHLVASATRTDTAAAPVVAEKTFTVTASTATPPTLAVTPADAARDFGDVNTGATAEAVFTVKNTGGGTLTGAASLSGDAVFQFSGSSTYSLAAGTSASVTVRFAPDKKGDFSGTLSFGGSGGAFDVVLTGSGVKTGGVFNCAGGRDTGAGGMRADLAVLALAATALVLGRRRVPQR